MSVQAVMADQVAQEQFHLTTSVPLLNVSGEVFSENSRLVESVSVLYSPKLDFKMMTTINP
jgi:GntR family transcriptional regulator